MECSCNIENFLDPEGFISAKSIIATINLKCDECGGEISAESFYEFYRYKSRGEWREHKILRSYQA